MTTSRILSPTTLQGFKVYGASLKRLDFRVKSEGKVGLLLLMDPEKLRTDSSNHQT